MNRFNNKIDTQPDRFSLAGVREYTVCIGEALFPENTVLVSKIESRNLEVHIRQGSWTVFSEVITSLNNLLQHIRGLKNTFLLGLLPLSLIYTKQRLKTSRCVLFCLM